jgi:glycosyltransferase involved in cell wall biosynthesis
MRDAGRWVAEAISSVLGQDLDELEVVVVDDGSTDDSRAVAEAVVDPRVRVLAQPPAGAAAARNLGVAAGRAPYLAFLDADDRWTPGKLARQLEVLEEQEEIEMVFGHAREIGAEGAPLLPATASPAFSSCSMLVGREAFDRVGPFDTERPVGEFIDWFARAEDAGLGHLMLPEVVMERRVHGANLTGGAHVRAEYARVVRDVAARRGQVRSASR